MSANPKAEARACQRAENLGHRLVGLTVDERVD